MVQVMNALVVFNSFFILANIARGDEENARLDTAIALLSSDGSSGGGGSGSTSAGGANIFHKIFGAEADAFGGIGGNPFSLSFLNTVMADMGDNLGTLALLEAINSQSSSKTTYGVDMTSASMVGDSSGLAAGFSGGSGVGGIGGVASSVGGGRGVGSSFGGGGGVGSHIGGGGGVVSSVGGGGGVASSVGGGGGVGSSFGGGGGVGSHIGGGGGVASSVGGGGGIASSVGGGGGVGVGSSFGGGGGVAGAGAWNMASGSGFRKDNIGGFGMSAHGGTTTGLETLLSMNDRGWGSGFQYGADNLAGGANARDNWSSSGLGRSDFHNIRPFPIPSQFPGPSIASSSASALSSDALMNNLHAFQGIGQDVGSLGSNINLNAFLSALIAARQSSGIDTNFIGDKLWPSPRLQNFDNQQNIASIMSSLQSRSQQSPIVIIGLDSFGNVKQVGNGRGILDAINRRDFSFDSRLDRDMGFDSRWGDRDRGFSRWDRDSRFKSLPSQESPAKDINLNIVVRQDQPVEKLRSHSSADRMTLENDLSLINKNDLGWFEFNNVDSSTGRFQQTDFNRKSGDAKGHPVFSFKPSPPVQQTIGGSSGMESYWKDSSNGAQIKPIPNMVARQQLDNFIAGTNRGDLWNQIGTHKGMAISDYTAQSPGFLPVDNLFGNQETQLQHSQQIIAYPKAQYQTSNPVFKVPGDSLKQK